MTEKSTFARRVRAAKPRTAKYEVRDDVVSGLALSIQPTGVRTFFLARMVRGRRRYATIGSADAMTVPEARREACRLIASYIEPAKQDNNGPRTPDHPMEAFAEEFLDRYARHWKPKTLTASTYVVRNHILPAFGDMTVDAITVEHVRDWSASMANKLGSTNRAMPALSVMMRMAELWGYRRHNSNPCKNTRRYKTEAKERFLTAEEMARLNAVLTRDEFWCPHIVAIVRLLMLTGCRFGEIASLEWDLGLDQGQAHLPARLEIWAAHGLAVQCRAGACRDPARSRKAGGIPVPELRAREGLLPVAQLLAHGLQRCESRQASPT